MKKNNQDISNLRSIISKELILQGETFSIHKFVHIS
jgi:hypothetical protein